MKTKKEIRAFLIESYMGRPLTPEEAIRVFLIESPPGMPLTDAELRRVRRALAKKDRRTTMPNIPPVPTARPPGNDVGTTVNGVETNQFLMDDLLADAAPETRVEKTRRLKRIMKTQGITMEEAKEAFG